MKSVYESRSLADNLGIAAKILKLCGDERIFAFFGYLGAGKTTLIKAFCQILGVKEAVSSPTFTLIHEYKADSDWVYHFDFYRLKGEEEAYELGVEEYFFSGAYCFIEWPEKIGSILPKDGVHVQLSQLPDTTRIIEVQYGEGSTVT